MISNSCDFHAFSLTICFPYTGSDHTGRMREIERTEGKSPLKVVISKPGLSLDTWKIQRTENKRATSESRLLQIHIPHSSSPREEQQDRFRLPAEERCDGISPLLQIRVHPRRGNIREVNFASLKVLLPPSGKFRNGADQAEVQGNPSKMTLRCPFQKLKHRPYA